MLTKTYAKYRYSLVLLRELVITEFKLRYQGSFLGYMWSLLKPLFLFAILYFVLINFLGVGSGVAHWPVKMLLGVVLWNFFAEITGNGVSSIVNRGDVIRKINFPKYVIIFSSSISALINLVLNFVIVAIFMAFNGVQLSWTAPLVILPVIELFLLGIGLAFILSTLYVKLRDVGYIWEIIAQALFYGSAVIFPLDSLISGSVHANPHLAKILLLNPVAQIISDARALLIDNASPTLYGLTHNIIYMAIPLGIVVVVFLAGALFFKVRSPYFAEDV